LKNKTPIEKMVNWAKGLKIDTKNELIISWS
jgi:WD40 repeat protein